MLYTLVAVAGQTHVIEMVNVVGLGVVLVRLELVSDPERRSTLAARCGYALE